MLNPSSRRWCQERQFSLLRLSEWDDVYAQVTLRAADLGIVAQRQAASYTAVHRSLLAGFCTMVGTRGEEGVYGGTRGTHFHIFPGSPLARRRPRWVMAANIIETSRIFARRVAEIEPQWIEGAAQLARVMLAGQARDLGKIVAANTALLLAAVPYLSGDALGELLLQWVFRRACFADAEAPRSREAYEQAVDQGRSRLHPCLEEIATQVLRWFTAARAVRRALDESRAPLLADAVDESHEYLRWLLSADTLESMSPDWLRQVPRYLQAESRRWQRAAARGAESPQVVRELREWSARYRQLAQQVGTEMRWIPELDELRNWIAEYRVSLCAQELKTLGPVSAARLEGRAAAVDAWIAR